MKTSRQAFVLGVMGACATGVLGAACGGTGATGGGGGSGGKGTGTAGSQNNGGTCSVKIATNHGHEMAVSSADLDASKAKQYDITGTASHAHTVSLAAADFADLIDGMSVTIESSTGGGHTHNVTISC